MRRCNLHHMGRIARFLADASASGAVITSLAMDSTPRSSPQASAPQTPASPTPTPPRRALDMRVLLSLMVVVVIAGGVALLVDGGSSGSPTLPGGVHSATSASYRGSEASPAAP